MPVVKVPLGSMAVEALVAAGASPDDQRLSLLLFRVVRFYLDESSANRPGWRYPEFLPRGRVAADRQVDLDEELWDELRSEAERQDVGAELLVQHAAFYWAAARDDGRLTERIVNGLTEEERGAGSARR